MPAPWQMPSQGATVLNSTGMRRRRRRAPFLDPARQLPQVIVPGVRLAPRVGDADERLLEVAVRVTHRTVQRRGYTRCSPSNAHGSRTPDCRVQRPGIRRLSTVRSCAASPARPRTSSRRSTCRRRPSLPARPARSRPAGESGSARRGRRARSSAPRSESGVRPPSSPWTPRIARAQAT